MPFKPLLLAAALAAQMAVAPPGRAAGTGSGDLAAYVNPFIGTGMGGPAYGIGNEGGHVVPGAAYPRGMVQWSPDTTSAAGGYRYGQHTIHGFSLTHFSGRGCASYQDVPFLPLTAPLTVSPAVVPPGVGYDHQHEAASPGYYRVLLRNGVDVALTATPRTGFGRFRYPAGKPAIMAINVGGSATGDGDAGTGIRIAGPALVTGSAASGHFCGALNTYTLYFAARFDHPFTAWGTWQGASLTAGGRSASGGHSGAYLTFDTRSNPTIQAQVGISFVSIANALANLAAEEHGWGFAAVQANARAAWDARLQAISIHGGTGAQRTIFYTALYHTLFHPNIFSDANGQYLGFDGRVHVAQGYVQYDNISGWDIYRSLIPLDALLWPHETGDIVTSLVHDAEQGGGALPRWEVANDNSGGLVGDSQDIVIAASAAFGARHFPATAALAAMLRGAADPTARTGHYAPRENLASYLALGYVPAPLPNAAATTLEYAADDFAISRYAASLGDRAAAAHYLTRALGWRRLFNPATGYVEPRDAAGNFPARFDPADRTGFVEGSSAQYTWLAPFDLPALFQMLGGDAAAIARLNAHFARLNDGPASRYAFMSDEPEFAVPWEYDFAGAPYRTQAVVRRIQTALFGATPGGLAGNDDGGALSSWYIFSALGLYPEVPGVGGFALGSPLFPQAMVHLGNGTLLTIIGQGATLDAPYVRALSLDGAPYGRTWLPYGLLSGGGTLAFTLSTVPNLGWAAGPAGAPPSFTGSPGQ